MGGRRTCRTAVIVVWALALTPAEGFSQNFEPTHIHKSASVSFDATPEAVFAVLVPAGQQSLSRNWEIDILWPLTGQVPPGAVFTKTHRHAEVQQVWTVAEVDTPRRLSYSIFVAGLETWIFEMDLQTDGPGVTRVDVKHTITSLSAEANPAVQELADTFDHYFEGWGTSIQRALDLGR